MGTYVCKNAPNQSGFIALNFQETQRTLETVFFGPLQSLIYIFYYSTVVLNTVCTLLANYLVRQALNPAVYRTSN